MTNYFLVSVSNRENLELCEKHALAGFTDSINGAWTFSDIQDGDFISFLYAARAHNLYQVEAKSAFRDAEGLPPWKPMTFKISGKKYFFPFRLQLKPVREFIEPLIRMEFAYVAENLLLRGGYRKTHFQADQTTLQSVSQMGGKSVKIAEKLEIASETFVPEFSTGKSLWKPPYIFPMRELILQSAVRQYLCDHRNLEGFLKEISVDEVKAENLEVLGEKALPVGHIDVFIKESVPIGESRNIIVELKLNKATKKDFQQLDAYLEEFGSECLGAVLIARDFSTKAASAFESRIKALKYRFSCDLSEPTEFGRLVEHIILEK